MNFNIFLNYFLAILNSIYTKSPKTINALDWTSKIYKTVTLTGAQTLIKCQALCIFEANNSCNLVVTKVISSFISLDIFLFPK